MMIKPFFLMLAFVSVNCLFAQSLNVGIKIQKSHLMYWENGISAQYSFKNFKPSQFYIGFEYLTSALGSALGSNALKQQRYLASAAWHFRKEKAFQIITKLNTGFFHVNLESEIFQDLPKNAFLLSPEVGLCYHFTQLPVAVQLGGSWNLNFAKEGYSPGTLTPLSYHLAIYYQLFKK
jgi:hypothetical protein